MLDELGCTCEAPGCARSLEAEQCKLVYSTPAGERRAYECDCGAVTMTVNRPEADDPVVEP